MEEREVLRKARSFAMRHGFGAQSVRVEIRPELTEPKILSRTDPGYRKKTTGQYVPNKYLQNFGWKNTYYQCADTLVGMPAE